MSSENVDGFDSVAKTGRIVAAGILGSVFFPVIISSFIGSWLEEQMAANPKALVFACFLAAIVGAGIACSVAIPIMKWQAAKRVKDLSERIAQFEKRPTQEQLDEALTKKEENATESLTGDAALNFIRCLTDNQHAILEEMYDNGGTLLADPLDGDMQQLAKYGMVERPSLFAPGVDTKWTLPPGVNSIIREHPDVLGNNCSNDSTMEDGIKRIAALPDEERSALEVLATMGVQALDLVHDMYVDTFVDTTTSWLNSVDAPGHIREIAHRSNDQPSDPDEYGKKLHRYRLNEETKRVLDKFPEVFDRVKQFHSELREMASYEKYCD